MKRRDPDFKQGTQRKMSRKLKISIWSISILAVLAVIAVVGISIYVGLNLMHPDKKPLDENPEQYGLNYEAFEVESEAGDVPLDGWLMESEKTPKGTIIMAHGYRGNRLEQGLPALALAKAFIDHEYNVIMFDFRNSGASGGETSTVGYLEKYDLKTVIEYADERFSKLPIGLIGFSMGGSTALITAPEAPLVQAVVADAPFADLRDYLKSNLSHWSDLPEFPFTPVILGILPHMLDMDMDQVSPREAIQEIAVPTLLIHGNSDVAIPSSNSEEIYQNSDPSHTELWITEGSDHVRSYADHTDQYVEKVTTFFDEAI